MQSEDLRITLIQADIIWEDIDRNLEKFKNVILSYLIDTDLIILPEYFTTGFTMNPRTYAETMDGKTIKWMREIAAVKQSALMGTTIIKERDGIYNRMIFINKDGNISCYDKRHLYKVEGEESYFLQGKTRVIAMLGQWRIFPLICYDLRFPVWSRYKGDYDILVYSASWPDARYDIWKTLLKARAIENQAYVAGVNRIGSDGQNLSYSGNSFVYSPQGQVLTEFKSNKEHIDTLTLSLKEIRSLRKKFPFHLDADEFRIFTDIE